MSTLVNQYIYLSIQKKMNNDANYCFASTVEGLASQIYTSLKQTLVQDSTFSHTIKFPDANIHLVSNRDLVIVISFHKKCVDNESDQECEPLKQDQEVKNIKMNELKLEEPKLQDTQKRDDQGWQIATNKKNTKKQDNKKYTWFRHTANSGYVDIGHVFYGQINNFPEKLFETEDWSHIYCEQDDMIYHFNKSQCYLSSKPHASYLDEIENVTAITKVYTFKEESDWHTWKFIKCCSLIEHVNYIKTSKCEWSHCYSADTKKIYNFRVLHDNKITCREAHVTSTYLQRFDAFLNNRKDLGLKL